MKNSILIILLVFLSNCTDKPEASLGSEVVIKNDYDSTANQKNLTTIGKLDTSIDSTNNELNTNNIKQGEIVTKNKKGEIISVLNYNNDTLDGYFFNWDGMQMDGNYLKGKKDGYFRVYYGDKTENNVMSVKKYKNDSLIWQAHPASDELYIYNPKGFNSPIDSIYIKVPRVNGTIWYEGLFINEKEKGKHKIYKKNGELYAIADYDSSIVYFPDNSKPFPLIEYGFKQIKQ